MRKRLILGMVLFGLVLVPVHGEDWPTLPMYQDPDLRITIGAEVLPRGTLELWQKALTHPTADMRCKAADAFAEAQRRKIKGLEVAIPDLLAALERKDQHPTVRLAVARALVDLNAKQAAASLWREAQAGNIDLRQVVEPALARWNHAPARTVWLERLGDSRTGQHALVLAIRCLAVAREPKAAEKLRERMLSNLTPATLRLEMARALAEISTTGLEPDARTLATDRAARGLVGRLAAVALLRRHASQEAIAFLQSQAKEGEPVVASLAAERLIEIDARLAADVRDSFLASTDANLRRHAVNILWRHATPDSIELLGKRLSDNVPDIRNQARRALHERATKHDQREDVITQTTKVLAGGSWQSQEQAMLLLSDLGHKPAAARMVELLPADRSEVFLTAAAGLYRLEEPTSLDAALRYAVEENARMIQGKLHPARKDRTVHVDHQVAYLLQLMGKQKYAAADAALRRFVPRNDKSGPESRAAAIWSLGLLHEGKVVAALVPQLEERLNDTATMPPEDGRVRRMCSITLGRMKSQDSLESLEKYAPKEFPSGDGVADASGWAMERITGKQLARAKPRLKMAWNWFLVPTE